MFISSLRSVGWSWNVGNTHHNSCIPFHIQMSIFPKISLLPLSHLFFLSFFLSSFFWSSSHDLLEQEWCRVSGCGRASLNLELICAIPFIFGNRVVSRESRWVRLCSCNRIVRLIFFFSDASLEPKVRPTPLQLLPYCL